MRYDFCCNDYVSVLKRRPDAAAIIKGSMNYPDIYGKVMFYQLPRSVLVRAEISGLPKGDGLCASPIYAFHIHGGTSCSGNETDPFADAQSHYNPKNCPHPYHSGDLPPIFSVNGTAFSVFLTDRFILSEVIGKAIIVHGSTDDFTTQPSGNAGEKIACGIIGYSYCR